MAQSTRNKLEHLQRRINKLEKLYIRSLAENRVLEDENKRLKDGSLAEYYKNRCLKVEKENATLSVKMITMQVQQEKYERLLNT